MSEMKNRILLYFRNLLAFFFSLQATQPGIVTGLLSSANLNETLSCDYFLIIGKLSSTQIGQKVLEKISGIFQ